MKHGFDFDVAFGCPEYDYDQLNSKIDWSQCQSVVRTQGVLSGRWRVKGTRIPVDAIIQNYNSGYSPEALATEIFVGLPVDLARDIVSYAAQKVALQPSSEAFANAKALMWDTAVAMYLEQRYSQEDAERLAHALMDHPQADDFPEVSFYTNTKPMVPDVI